MLGLGKKKEDNIAVPKPPASSLPKGGSFGQIQPPEMPTPPDVEPRLQTKEPQQAVPIEVPANVSAPLFVKIDKYTDIQTHLKELQTYSSSMKRTLDKLQESHKKLSMSLTMSYNTLDRIDSSLRHLEDKFANRLMRTHPTHGFSIPNENPHQSTHHATDEELETYLKDINSQVSKIKTELNSVK